MDNWFIMGDIHGKAAPLYTFYKDNKERLNLDSTRTYIILLGDVGLNFSLGNVRDKNVKDEISRLPFTYICLRGNHESRITEAIQYNQSGWHIENRYGGNVYVENGYSKIHYLEDIPALYKFSGYKTLSVPGAYSVDKEIRLLLGWPWFADEQLTEEEKKAGKELARKEKTIRSGNITHMSEYIRSDGLISFWH